MNDTKHSIATLEVIFELSNLKDILSGFLRQGLTASVLFLILAAIMISYFSRLFNLPLKKMSQVALSGDLQLISKVKTDSKIVEISMLESAIRKMGEQILDLNEKDRENFKNAAIGRIIAHLTHDLRAPLGTFERLLQTPDEKMPTMRSAVKDSLNRLNSMIESLRHSEVENLVKKSASKINFPFGRESLQGKADDHKIALLIPTEDPGKVWIDPMKVERAWINLASNAIEAAKSFVRVEAGKQDTSLFIRVIDDGPGVPDNILPKLFQRGMTSDKAGGTGLGLAYVRQVMQGHGGDVTYRRENGLTIFECFLPHAVDRNEAETLAEKESQVIEKEVKTKQISVCFTPDSYGESLITHLVNFQNPRFKFTNAYKDDSEVVVTNDDDLSMKSLNEGKETIKISKALTAEELASRLAYRLNIKS